VIGWSAPFFENCDTLTIRKLDLLLVYLGDVQDGNVCLQLVDLVLKRLNEFEYLIVISLAIDDDLGGLMTTTVLICMVAAVIAASMRTAACVTAIPWITGASVTAIPWITGASVTAIPWITGASVTTPWVTVGHALSMLLIVIVPRLILVIFVFLVIQRWLQLGLMMLLVLFI